MRFVEAILPARMGASFRWLIGATWLSNLGDGIAVAAGPLLVAQQTEDPLLVAFVLPPLLVLHRAYEAAEEGDSAVAVPKVNKIRKGYAQYVKAV